LFLRAAEAIGWLFPCRLVTDREDITGRGRRSFYVFLTPGISMAKTT